MSAAGFQRYPLRFIDMARDPDHTTETYYGLECSILVWVLASVHQRSVSRVGALEFRWDNGLLPSPWTDASFSLFLSCFAIPRSCCRLGLLTDIRTFRIASSSAFRFVAALIFIASNLAFMIGRVLV